jgi:uncharacterized lipoprotein NlpE involved in copper resistance
MTEGAEKTVEELLAEAAQATEAATPPKAKKERAKKEEKLYPQKNQDGTPALDADGNPIMGVKSNAYKAPKEPKPAKTYPQANEDGTAALDADGNPVMGPYATRYKAPKAPKAPRLDADGNPISRGSNVYLETQVLRRTEAAAAFKARETSKRGQMFAAAKDGLTVGEFYEQNGGKAAAHTFLVWYINEAKVIELDTPAA